MTSSNSSLVQFSSDTLALSPLVDVDAPSYIESLNKLIILFVTSKFLQQLPLKWSLVFIVMMADKRLVDSLLRSLVLTFVTCEKIRSTVALLRGKLYAVKALSASSSKHSSSKAFLQVRTVDQKATGSSGMHLSGNSSFQLTRSSFLYWFANMSQSNL